MTDEEGLVRPAPGAGTRVGQPPGLNGRTGKSAYLHPGQLIVAAEPCTVTTILGSCVGVCLHDEKAGIGGVNHFLLPHWAEGSQATPRFGNVAMRALLDEMRRQGADPRRIRAKVFGGACVIDAYRDGKRQLGEENVRVALQLLEVEGVKVVASDTGGHRGRKVVFETHSGDAWVKQI